MTVPPVKSPDDVSPAVAERKARREARLADQLRLNLRRRKGAASALAEADVRIAQRDASQGSAGEEKRNAKPNGSK